MGGLYFKDDMRSRCGGASAGALSDLGVCIRASPMACAFRDMFPMRATGFPVCERQRVAQEGATC